MKSLCENDKVKYWLC